MASQQMVMYEEEFKMISAICGRLQQEAHAKAVLLIDRNGQFITSQGDIDHIDATSLASLTAGNVAATSGLAKLIGEKEFPNIYHEGEKDNLHLSIVAQRAILLVMFDAKSSLGLVRLRVKKTAEELRSVFTNMLNKAAQGSHGNPFSDISDEDIDNLFGE